MVIADHNRFGADTGEFRVTSNSMFVHPKYQSGNGLDWDVCLIKSASLSYVFNRYYTFNSYLDAINQPTVRIASVPLACLEQCPTYMVAIAGSLVGVLIVKWDPLS